MRLGSSRMVPFCMGGIAFGRLCMAAKWQGVVPHF
jgi:hypothetical protein